jgi:protein-S-isoprenylcysteine O-methyltransferase Ste14
MVAVVIPALLVASSGTNVGWGLDGAPASIPVLAGLASLAAGLRLAVQTIALFGSAGEGTLAPWDPTRRLVVAGPYRRVRNPMITGVALILLGEALLLGSPAIAIELAVFAALNAAYMPLFEEPGLLRRFGDEYAAYRDAVPRWIPRRSDWDPR